jgi:hypothetical protein
MTGDEDGGFVLEPKGFEKTEGVFVVACDGDANGLKGGFESAGLDVPVAPTPKDGEGVA